MTVTMNAAALAALIGTGEVRVNLQMFQRTQELVIVPLAGFAPDAPELAPLRGGELSPVFVAARWTPADVVDAAKEYDGREMTIAEAHAFLEQHSNVIANDAVERGFESIRALL